MSNVQNQGFIRINQGNFAALVLPENLHKVESKLAKVKPNYKPAAARELARTFPLYKSGMSTGEYVRAYEKANALCFPYKTGLKSPFENLNFSPAAEYDPTTPLMVQDENPDFNPADELLLPVKVKAPRVSKQAARIAALEVALDICISQMQQAQRLVDCQDFSRAIYAAQMALAGK